MSKSKKVLIISYYWPPAGGISVLRSLKIAKHLATTDWEPIIYTVKDGQYPIIESDNEKHVPAGITVLKQPCFEPFELYKKLTGRKKNDTLANVLNANSSKKGLIHQLSVWVRANFFIPDARSMWIKPSVKFLSAYLQNHPVDAVMSIGPPHTNTLIAFELSQKLNIPWLMDWQDPWTEVDYYKLFPIGKRAHKVHTALEKKCLKQASAMTIVSPSWKHDAEKLGAHDVEVVYWGYDPDDFQGLKKQITESFIISHIGLLGEDRISLAFFKAVGELCAESPSFKNDVKLVFDGTVTGTIQSIIELNKLNSVTTIIHQSPRKNALQLVLDSTINLSFLNKSENAKGRIPGKLFEYIYANNSILNLGPVDCDVNTILSELGNGKTYEYDDLKGIKHYVEENYIDWKNKKTKTVDQEIINQYAIKQQFRKIEVILNNISKKP